MDTQSLTAAASAVQQATLLNQVDIAVASKTLQAQRDQGQAAVDLIAQAAKVQSQLNAGKIDVKL